MPIRPAPFTLKCGQCGWKHTFTPQSDVLLPKIDIHSRCPRCGTVALTRSRANLIEQVSSRLRQVWPRT
ncbi:hypothetical protein F3J17_11410 [Burkholderia sp. Ax-1719]|nr:hypothetical protein [Burkholderia sp. Ax-1719]